MAIRLFDMVLNSTQALIQFFNQQKALIKIRYNRSYNALY